MSTSFQVGDQVQVPLGNRRLPGVITEDRGSIGLRGRHLYQVLVSMDPFEPATFELSEDELESIGPKTALERAKILDYLINGGLIAILRSNTAGGRNQPRVWLRSDSAGNVTHTFDPTLGVVGGEVIPFMAIHEDRIFSPKRDEVLNYLQGFKISRKDAEQILTTIGTAP